MARAVRAKASFMDDLLREFLTETSESLDTVDNQLVRFEQDPSDAKISDNIFRLVHTIKGTCGFLGLPRLEALAHAGETLMGKFRDGMPVKGEAVTLILSSIDRIKEILAGLEATEAEPEGTDEDLIEQVACDGRGRQSWRSRSGLSSTRAGCRSSANPARDDSRHAGRPGAGARAASRRSLARRSRARLPRDRDRSRQAPRSAGSELAPAAPAPKAEAASEPRAKEASPPKRPRPQGDVKDPTRLPTSRSASTSIRWSI